MSPQHKANLLKAVDDTASGCEGIYVYDVDAVETLRAAVIAMVEDEAEVQAARATDPMIEKPTADTPYVEVDGVTYLARWYENKSSYVVETEKPDQIAARIMVAARNAQMFQDIRSVIAACADLKARAPYRHIEAQRLLPLLDAFLGEGYTGRVVQFKRARKSQQDAESQRSGDRS